MSNEIKYLYRILTGIILFLSNNEFTWKIINYFANFNGEPYGKMFSAFNMVLVIVSLLGLVIALFNAVLLFLLTFNTEKKVKC
jgi:uncharacterized membrane protein